MLTMKDIVREGHKSLSTIAKPVAIPLQEEDIKIMKDMLQFVINSQNPQLAQRHKLRESVGIAAPQINLSKRIIAVHTEDDRGVLYSIVLANPKIISHSAEKTYLPMGEGCLSVDRNVSGIVPRNRRLTIEGYNMKNELVKLRLRDYIAVVFQHELDHLDGVLFTDRIDKTNPFGPIPNAEPLEF